MSKTRSNDSNENKQGMLFMAQTCQKMDFGVKILKI